MQLGQGKRQEIAYLNLLSPCRLSLRFTFAPRHLFHVAQAAAYQAVRYTAEIMQVGDTT